VPDPSPRRRRRPALAGLTPALLLAAAAATAQEPAPDPSEGLHYYALQRLDDGSGEIERRGTTQSTGRAFSSLILAPRTRYRIWVLRARDLRVASVTFTTPRAGQRFRIPDFVLRPVNPHDPDADGLPTAAETIVGTNEGLQDTDSDGLSDGEEVRSGADPLDGLPGRVGILASVETPGVAIDVVGVDETLVVVEQDGDAGSVALYNAFAGLDPRAIARVSMPAPPTQAACTSRSGRGAVVAVADGAEGLVVVDVSDPPAAEVLYRVSPFLLAGEATSVEAIANLAFVGTNTGRLAVVDLDAGLVLDRIELGQPVVDLAVSGDVLYALGPNDLFAVTFDGAVLAVTAIVASPTGFSPGGPNRKVFAGVEAVYAVHGRGTNAFDIAVDPLQPMRVATTITPQFGWQDFAANGSGLAVAAVGNGSSPRRTDGVSVFDLSDPFVTDSLLFGFDTPGPARRVSLFNGRAYAADGDGLQVLNYRAADTQGVAPTISLSTTLDPAAGVEEGQLARVRADVADDVQVRNVEVFVDGERLTTDGTFPFEAFFTAPSRAGGKERFVLQARVFDTGGNFTWSDPLTVPLTADQTAPFARRVFPSDGAFVARTSAVGVVATELLDEGTLAPALSLTAAGPDGALGTADDVPVPGGVVEYRERTATAALVFSPPLLEPGLYEARLATTATDLAGNPFAADASWRFTIYGTDADDGDADGVPDVLEAALGLDPTAVDTDGDSIPDGLEDADMDGSPNALEALLGTDATLEDTDMNGVADGDEDQDRDRVEDGREFLAGTNLFARDADGDGFDDHDELDNASPPSDPLDPTSVPVRSLVAPFGVRNDERPAVLLGEALTTLSARNDERPEVLLGEALTTLSARNEAAPEAVAGETRAKVTSVENDVP